jgi:hydrogenase expression/formation protein HypE
VKIGKLDHDELRKLVLERLPEPDPRIASGPAVGVDCSAVRFGDGQVVISTDPITGAASGIGRLAVIVACNDIAACGIRPTVLLLTIIAPPNTTADEIRSVIDQAAAAACKLNVSIVGGHTEISDAVTRFVVSSTAIGFTYGDHTIQATGGRPGDALVMTKTAGLEGTAILAADHAARLAGPMTADEIAEARGLINRISVIEEGSCGGDLGVHAMHDATEGGILGACWELAEASGLGCIIEQDRIPVHPLTMKICGILRIDPLRLVASGSMIIATPDPEKLLSQLSLKGIAAAIIGILTENGPRIVQSGDETLELSPPGPDELYKIT